MRSHRHRLTNIILKQAHEHCRRCDPGSRIGNVYVVSSLYQTPLFYLEILFHPGSDQSVRHTEPALHSISKSGEVGLARKLTAVHRGFPRYGFPNGSME